MAFLLIKFFAEITYQWITVTHLIFATTLFSSFVVPDPGMGVSTKPTILVGYGVSQRSKANYFGPLGVVSKIQIHT
jgi:hypothetical protein